MSTHPRSTLTELLSLIKPLRGILLIAIVLGVLGLLTTINLGGLSLPMFFGSTLFFIAIGLAWPTRPCGQAPTRPRSAVSFWCCCI